MNALQPVSAFVRAFSSFAGYRHPSRKKSPLENELSGANKNTRTPAIQRTLVLNKYNVWHIKAAAFFAAPLIATSSFASQPSLPEVVVTESYITDFPINPFWIMFDGYRDTAMEAAMLAHAASVERKGSVCVAPVSSAARSVTRDSDMTSRWLAAQEVFNWLEATNYLKAYNEIGGNLQIILNGRQYAGFRVAYADGTRETWAINPGHKTSSIKLLDEPFPNSMNINKKSFYSCNAG